MAEKPKWSTRIDDKNPVHTRVSVFNHGGLAGTLCVNTADHGDLLMRLADSVQGPEEVERWNKVMEALDTLYQVYFQIRSAPLTADAVKELMEAYTDWLG